MSLIAASSTRSGRWTADPGFGVYVHVPFCLHRCNYCDFNTYDGKSRLQDPYVEALIADIERTPAPDGPATSVYFGGGTPTLLRPEQLGRILAAVSRTVGIAPGAEITIEANPETVDEHAFEALMRQGFNRFSIGIQSLSNRVLIGLDRQHSADVAWAALAAARRAGADDVNADIIYGSPFETDDDLEETCRSLIDSGCRHISAYALTVEEGTPLDTLVRTGRAPDVDPELQAQRAESVDRLLGAAGYVRYEISNWSLPDGASAHNLLYWCGGEYLGFGAGAHGHLAGRRNWMVRRPEEFIARVSSHRSTEAGHELLDPAARAREALVLGLRLLSGIDLDAFVERFAPDHALVEKVDGIVRLGLLEKRGGWLRPTPRGLEMASEVARRLL